MEKFVFPPQELINSYIAYTPELKFFIKWLEF